MRALRSASPTSKEGAFREKPGKDYISHPVAVREMTAWHGGTTEMQIAALLHDVTRGTGVTVGTVQKYFGQEVADMVLALACPPAPGNATRVQRFIHNVRHLEQRLDARPRMIKLADLLDTGSAVLRHDPAFSAVYLAEKELMLAILFDGKKTGAIPEATDYLERKGREHSLLIQTRTMISGGIAGLQQKHKKRYENHKALIWQAWQAQ